MSAVALQGLLDYLLDTLSVSNRRWLAEHLIEAEEKPLVYTREELIADTEEAVDELHAGHFRSNEEMSAKVDAIIWDTRCEPRTQATETA